MYKVSRNKNIEETRGWVKYGWAARLLQIKIYWDPVMHIVNILSMAALALEW